MDLGEYFLDSLFSDIASLILCAGIHRKFMDYHLMLAKRFPYGIYYKMDEGLVIVWRVLDMRQDPSKIQKHLTD